jgi:hypothetical protein
LWLELCSCCCQRCRHMLPHLRSSGKRCWVEGEVTLCNTRHASCGAIMFTVHVYLCAAVVCGRASIRILTIDVQCPSLLELFIGFPACSPNMVEHTCEQVLTTGRRAASLACRAARMSLQLMS